MTSSFLPPRRRRLLQGGLALAAAPALAGWPAIASTAWPERPLKLVVGFPPGTSPDATARLLAEPLARALGQPVVVDNRAGAAGTIGVSAVATATDGHTVGLTGNGPLTTARLFNPRLPYDVARDLQPITLVASSPFVLVGRAGLPADLPALVAYCREQGERISYGSAGTGSGSHLAMELLKKLTGMQAVHVPFLGLPQAAQALVGGQVDLAFLVPSTAAVQAKAGRVRLYGIGSATRTSATAGLAPIAQLLGQPRFDVTGWNAVFAPASLPAPHAARLAAELGRIVRSDEVRQKLFDLGWQALGTAPQGLAQQIREETVRWREVVQLTGAKTE